MCGRYTLALEHEQLLLRLGFEPFEFEFHPRYNIAPMQQAPVVAIRDGERALSNMRWGLVPSWAKDEKMAARMINARAETVAQKPSFKRSLRTRRCLVPATGYFEWKELLESRPTRKVKAPMYFAVRGGEPFSFAGLWDHWRRFDGKEVESFAIITTEPNELSRPIHDRMPVILRPEDEAKWLDQENDDIAGLVALLRPYRSDEMAVYEVSAFVNSPRNDSPQCIAPVT